MKFGTATSASEVRDHIIECLRRELVGPSPGHPLVQLNGEEILRPQDPPRYRYSAGILFPKGVHFSAALDARDEAPDLETAAEVATGDEGAASENLGSTELPEAEGRSPEDRRPDTEGEVDAMASFLPSSMGISFLASPRGGLRLEATWGTYRKEVVRGYHPPKKDGGDQELWFRVPGKSKPIELSFEDLGGEAGGTKRKRITVSPEGGAGTLVVEVVSRRWSDGLERLVTVTLINDGEVVSPINEHCFFQCELKAFPLGDTSILPYPGRPEYMQDDEEVSLALLYRHRPTYAVGHGCSADWRLEDGRVVEVRTEVMPVFEQAPIVPLGDAEGVELSMRKLGELPAEGIVASCEALARAYEQWIADREGELSGLDGRLHERGREHLDRCRDCLARMRDGIALLRSDADAMAAFKIMNLAMVEQRAHYALSSEEDKRRSWRKGPGEAVPSTAYRPPEYPTTTRWRPFQLAFVLMNIRSFVDVHHPDRSLVDVIWFPTGGGKTEAYLGLAAFVILLRRLRAPDDAGTTVLMRYTLRLLTTQQFQRAASLICALEKRRRADPRRFGDVPITIGLWLGGSVTPNKDSDALHKLRQLEHGEADNPFVVLSCPWCGIDMGPREYDRGTRVFGYKPRTFSGGSTVGFRCEDPDCEFSSEPGLPLEVVDESIYRSPPTLLIGTVDKFAMMPWTPESRLIFGIDNPAAKSPPELIIQDELHLISGPLGSMVGHYETVIDELTHRQVDGKRVPAKIVASTATIARASEQIQAVYARRSALFPPQGLVAGESFFAREDTQASGRTYVGVLATAVPSHVTAQVRTLATLLQAPALVDGDPGALDRHLDPYWSLVVYFNSLRELGRASTLVQADIREHLNAVWDRIGLPIENERRNIEARRRRMKLDREIDIRRFINNFDELTSRMRSNEIPAVLQKLFTPRPSRDVVDLCYATNMIQVGLDVPRLSIMSIVGQPKGASEYIQASSRVGRGTGKPGLVITNFNPFKPRDRSHFENFRSFHENAYRHVEPTSVTPFSIPVCDRAIHAVAVALIRALFPHLRDSPRGGISSAERTEVTSIIMRRVEAVDPTEAVRARQALDRFFDDWDRRRPQEYGTLGVPVDPLMIPAGRALPPMLAHLAPVVRSTATSMRNVDADCEAAPIPFYSVEA